MTSWRETASQSAQDDLDGLLNTVLPVTEDLLAKHGEFHPFGALVSSEGESSLTAADPRLGAHPTAEEVLQSLYDGARAGATTSRAAAFVSDVRAGSSDAVRVELEHRDGVALDVLVPYKRNRQQKKVAFGQMSLAEGEPRVWVED